MKKHDGFTLIEVLVALVVLSIGLLGMAALHIDGVRTSHAALQRTQAVNLAADMADRIRANPLGDYNVGAGAAVEPAIACADTPAGEAPGNCTPNAMAAYDVWQWRTALDPARATGLPDGAGRIDVDNTTTPVSTIVTVSWSERGATRNYRLTVQQ